MSQMMRAHLISAGLKPHQAGRIEKNILLWIQSSGPEWTVDRLKAMKVWYLHRLSGERIPLESPSWLKVDEKGFPSGVFRPIFALKKVRKTLDALMVYTGIYLCRPSRRQEKKFFSSVGASPVRIGYVPYLYSVVEDFMSSISIQYENGKDSYKSYSWSGRKFLPNIDCKRTIPNRISSLISDFQSHSVEDALQKDAIEYEISHSLGNLYPMLLDVMDQGLLPDSHHVGKIGCIQEKGCKGRFIANPRITFQLGLWNTARYLQDIQRALPTDCTFRQEAGVSWLKEKLREGKTSYSVDLSDASNHVPYRLTRHILRWCGVPSTCMELLDFVSLGPYRYPRTNSTVYWTKGQPLGTYPSFPAFSLTLGFVLRAIEKMVGDWDSFRTLGDDVIITSDKVHKRFRDFLDQHDMPVSEDKCLTGNVGEFASYLISKKSSFRPKKVVRPTQSNIQYQILRNLELGGGIRLPSELVTYAEYLMSKGENSLGLSIKQRAQLLIAAGLDVEKRETKLHLSWGKGLYNSLKYSIMNHFKENVEDKPFSRDAYQKILDILSSHTWRFGSSDQEEPIILSLLRYLKIPDVIVSDPDLEACIRNSVRTRCPTLHPDFFSSMKVGWPQLHAKIRRAVKAQERIVKQSRAVSDIELQKAMLKLLEFD